MDAGRSVVRPARVAQQVARLFVVLRVVGRRQEGEVAAVEADEEVAEARALVQQLGADPWRAGQLAVRLFEPQKPHVPRPVQHVVRAAAPVVERLEGEGHLAADAVLAVLLLRLVRRLLAQVVRQTRWTPRAAVLAPLLVARLATDQVLLPAAQVLSPFAVALVVPVALDGARPRLQPLLL